MAMNSVFDWIERPLSAQRRMPPKMQRDASLFEPQQCQDPTGDAFTDFACEPETDRPSTVRRLVYLENTYQLEPYTVFKPHVLKPVMKLILDSTLQDKTYDKDEAPELCKHLADVIKDQAMKLKLPRYKFISDVTIGQKHGQGYVTASRCLWDDSRDNFTSVTFENKSLFAVATFYALNYE
ncbi:dynein light chain Tctex-type protein 2B-like [Littorina saxatilis]|uniref:Uncharacterized protein n=1 Tax=Littorina saxatilis TaxID=31220 RepID=A0AAN9GA93_9CAEN